MNRKCINKTLAEAPAGKTWSWKNPKTGNGGTVTPTSPLPRRGAESCRTFDESVTLKDGRSEKISGRACKRPDGSWQLSINCLPAYLYTGDQAPGDALGHGVNNLWWAINPAGKTAGK